MPLRRIRQIPNSIRGPDSGYSDYRFLWFFFLSPSKCLNDTINYATNFDMVLTLHFRLFSHPALRLASEIADK
jgi:hypothetical protein